METWKPDEIRMALFLVMLAIYAIFQNKKKGKGKRQ